MTTTETKQSHKQQDAIARAYILAMKAGQKPVERPDISEHWEIMVVLVEEAYAKYGAMVGAMELIIEGHCKTYPALADLLKPTTGPLQGGEESKVWVPPLPEAARLDVRLSAGACPELEMYEKFSREASPEAYDGFHEFCGLWLFSVIGNRRVHARIKRKRFYTNLMIALFAETSMFAKSFTAKAAKDVLYELHMGYLLAPNRITPQKLWSDMSGSFVPTNYADLEPERQERQRRRLAMPGQKGLYFDEFGKFVQSILRKNSTSSEFVDMFLEFDECPDTYENSTISRGGEPIEKPSIALLGAMTPPNLKDNAKSGADFWTDGFWARYSFVVAPPATSDTIREDIDDDDDEKELPIPSQLLAKLQAWDVRLGIPNCTIDPIYDDKKGELTGKYKIYRDPLPEHECTMTPEVRKAWKTYRYTLRRMCLSFPHKDFHGSYNRLPETAMRIAVIMASLSNNNHIEIRHLAKALELTERLRHYLHELYAQVNLPIAPESIKATIEDEVERHLMKHGALTLNTLKHSYMKKNSVKEIEDALKGLKRAGIVEEFSTGAGWIKFKLIENEE